MLVSDIKGLLVGSDDHIKDGYNWIINKKDWDNGCNVCTKKIDLYKDIEGFHIYFYVFKTKSDKPAKDSDEFRGKIFGFADIAGVEVDKYPEYNFRHHIKIGNLKMFTPKIRLEEFQNRLEYYGWSESQIKKFGNSLATHGLLLTERDCEYLKSQH